MNKNIKILLVIIVLLLSVSLGVSIWSGFVLFKSVKLGSNYIKSTCLVQKTYDNSLCINPTSSCYSQNQDIWWYNYWGPSYFIYVSGSDNDIYDDGEYDGNDDGTYSGNGDGEYDGNGGFDEGGEGGEGGIRIDGEMLRNIKKQRDSTSGASDLSNIKEFKNVKKQQQQRQSNENIKADYLFSSGSSDSSICVYNGCYQGEFIVSYNVNDKSFNSTIQGLVSQYSTWVDSYLDKFSEGEYYYCYYDSKEPQNVVWFEPPQYKVLSLVGFLISTILTIFFVAMLILIIKRSTHNHSYSRIN